MREIKQQPELNRVSIWQPIIRDKLDFRAYDRYIYLEKGILKQAEDLKQTVVRYAKNYKVDKKKFSLIVISLESDTKKMEKFLDGVAKEIKATAVDGKLKNTKYRYGV